MKINCLIVDDEPLAIEIIETYLKEFSDIEIVGKCGNAVKAFEIIKRNSIDLLFLDIQMPQLTGVEFLKTLANPPLVIFTTAYRDYAVDGYDLNIIDYLLKPISLERFIKAMDKFYDLFLIKNKKYDKIEKNIDAIDYLYVKSERKMVKVFVDEIYFIESLKDYIVIHKKEKRIITKQAIGTIEKLLPLNKFLRIHRSYIVALNKIEAYTQTTIELLNKELPIGRNYKEMVLKYLGAVDN